jgi:hypothetical protein
MLFDETAELLLQIGFKDQMKLTPAGWEAEPL